jgi:hypothetical protein
MLYQEFQQVWDQDSLNQLWNNGSTIKIVLFNWKATTYGFSFFYIMDIQEIIRNLALAVAYLLRKYF